MRATAEAADAARQLDEALKRGAVTAPSRPLLAARGVTAAPLASSKGDAEWAVKVGLALERLWALSRTHHCHATGAATSWVDSSCAEGKEQYASIRQAVFKSHGCVACAERHPESGRGVGGAEAAAGAPLALRAGRLPEAGRLAPRAGALLNTTVLCPQSLRCIDSSACHAPITSC